jgi:hypothetical protein
LVSLFWTVFSLLFAKIASPPENSRLYEAVVANSQVPLTTGLGFSSGFAAACCSSRFIPACISAYDLIVNWQYRRNWHHFLTEENA